jgi:hypothetical protein
MERQHGWTQCSISFHLLYTFTFNPMSFYSLWARGISVFRAYLYSLTQFVVVCGVETTTYCIYLYSSDLVKCSLVTISLYDDTFNVSSLIYSVVVSYEQTRYETTYTTDCNCWEKETDQFVFQICSVNRSDTVGVRMMSNIYGYDSP